MECSKCSERNILLPDCGRRFCPDEEDGGCSMKIRMEKIHVRGIIVLSLFTLLSIQCSDNNPLKPENHDPVIRSLTAFPAVIGLTDSVVVICNAVDPDGDTLVYDWISDGRLIVQGAIPSEHFLYNTIANSHVFYPGGAIRSPVDTPWVQCFARDRKGGQSLPKLVEFIVRQ